MGSAHVKEVCHRLEEAGYREAAEAIRNRPPGGAVLTDQQKMDLWNVIRDWTGEVDAEAPDDVVKLREALEADHDVGRGGG